jgi:hypothetical protein
MSLVPYIYKLITNSAVSLVVTPYSLIGNCVLHIHCASIFMVQLRIFRVFYCVVEFKFLLDLWKTFQQLILQKHNATWCSFFALHRHRRSLPLKVRLEIKPFIQWATACSVCLAFGVPPLVVLIWCTTDLTGFCITFLWVTTLFLYCSWSNIQLSMISLYSLSGGWTPFYTPPH